jgi:AmmeMemoRadiSam system protein A
MMELQLEPEEKRMLLSTARETITAELEGRQPHYLEPSPSCMRPGGAFVTIHERGMLRGCIGRMESSSPLFDTIKSMAIAAAFEDPRFDPLAVSELHSVDIEISVLSPMRRISSADEVIIGTHGLFLVAFGRSGVLLPQVATENGWDRIEFLEYVCKKAGVPEHTWKSPHAELYVFEGLVFGEKS